MEALAVIEITDKDKTDNKDMLCPCEESDYFDITQHFSQTICHPSINKCTIRSYILVNGFVVLFCFLFNK